MRKQLRITLGQRYLIHYLPPSPKKNMRVGSVSGIFLDQFN